MRKKSGTCLAAIKLRDGRVAMAADRRVSWDFGQAQKLPRPKVSKRSGLILAGTGDLYLCDLIVHLLDIPEYTYRTYTRDDIDSYMHNQFFNSVNRLLKIKNFRDEHGLLKIPVDSEVEVIIAVKGLLYSLVIYNPDPLSTLTEGLVVLSELALPYATGCGGQLAWGSLLTLKELNTHLKKEHLITALQVASVVSPGCDDNIDIFVE